MSRSLGSGGRTPRCVMNGDGSKVTRGQNHERKQRFRMGSWGGGWLRPTLTVFLVMSCGIGRAYALDIAYCSSDNTGLGTTPMTSVYQSNGLCRDYCTQDNFAFAILQGSKCWCSNYIPQDQSTGCTLKCPGYPDDLCGNTSKNLFGYIALDNAPSGTLGPSSTVRTTSNPPASSASPSPIDSTSAPTLPSISTVVEVKPGPTKTLIITTTQSATSKSTTSTSVSTSPSAPPPTPTPPPAPPTPDVVEKTVTFIPPTASPTVPAAASSSNDNFFSQPGRVAGLVIGIVIIVILIVVGLLFFCYRRSRRRNAHGGTEAGGAISAGGAGIMGGRRRSRSLSTLGLIGGEKGFSASTAAATGPPDMAGLNGVANGVARGPDGTKLVDQRLDPSQLYLRYDPDTGSSRMSVRSLRDDADYSRRVLRLANPDD